MNLDIITSISLQLKDSAALKLQIEKTLINEISEAAEMMVDAVRAGNKIMFCGNGGSAADSQHLTAELVGRYKLERPAISAIALTTDTSIITALGNDYGYESIFKRQVESLGKPGDLIVGISTSGSSGNVVAALRQAGEMGLKRIIMTGSLKGEMSHHADIVISVPSDDTPRIQEAHSVIGHILCDIIEKQLYG